MHDAALETRPVPRIDDPLFFHEDPDAAFSWMRREAPNFRYEFECEGRTDSYWILTRWEDIRAVEANAAGNFTSTNGVLVCDPRRTGMSNAVLDHYRNVVLWLDPPEQIAYRRLISMALTPQRVKRFEAAAREISRDVVDRIPRGGVVDAVEDVAGILPALMILDLIGLPRSELELVRMALAPGDSARPTPEMLERRTRFSEYLDDVISHYQSPRPDAFLTVLCEANVGGNRISHADLIGYTIFLIAAGVETTTTTITGGLVAWSRFPDQFAAVRGDRGLVPNAVEEILRWWSPVNGFARTAVRDVPLHGETIRAGDYVFMPYLSGNRDADVWGDDADTFDVRREHSMSHVSFGFGQHVCAGASLARLEMRVMFDELLNDFASVTIAGEPDIVDSTIIHGYHHLPIAFE